MDWKAALRLKKKSRREKVQDTATEVIHNVTHEVAKRAEQKMKEARTQARKTGGHLLERADGLGENVREQAGASAEALREGTNAQVSAMLAALGGLTANWDELLHTLNQEMEQRGEKRAQGRKKATKKTRSYPGFWIWLLRLGVGFWFIERLRSRDVAEYIDHGAGEEMRVQSRHHPVEWYKDLLDTLLIPNASLVALATIIAEGLVALGFITGLNRRLAALFGLVLSGNELLAHHNNSEKRGQDLLVLLSQMLLLRTGG
jgi:uncharacterized membrane protein YphA (DoxX/SURF4 family)